MLEAVAKLGQYSLRERQPPGIDDYADLTLEERDELVALVGKPKGQRREATHTVALILTRQPPIHYLRCHIAEVERDDPLRYLYRSGPSQGALNLPYGMFTDKVWKNRFVQWFNALKRDLPCYDFLSPNERDFLMGLLASFEQTQEQMANDLPTTVAEYPKSKEERISFFATLAFEDGKGVHYLGSPELPFYRLLLYRNKQRLMEGKGAQRGRCAICGNEDEISGQLVSDVFKFATFDKPGYVAGWLDNPINNNTATRLAWRNLPLCYRCYLHLEEGRRFVEDNLNRRFVGLNYWLIPNFATPFADDAIVQETLGILRAYKNRAREDVARRTARLLEPQEDDLLYLLSESRDYMSLQFVFVEKAQARERILLATEDILPSRLRRRFQVKRNVEAQARDAGWLDAPYNWEYTLGGSLRPFFLVDRGEGRNPELRRKEFLAMVDAVFRGTHVDRRYLLGVIMGRLRGLFVKLSAGADQSSYWDFRHAVRDALLTIMFMAKIGVLETVEEEKMEPIESTDPFVSYLEGFFARHRSIFPNEAAKAVFLLGGLTEMLLGVQSKRLNGNRPFYKQLKSLRMNQRDLLVILPKVQDKLIQYDELKGRRRRTTQAASLYLARAGLEPWPLGTDELNLVFTLGMNLQDVLWKRLEPESEEEEPEEAQNDTVAKEG